jgi:hypothetical protein
MIFFYPVSPEKDPQIEEMTFIQSVSEPSVSEPSVSEPSVSEPSVSEPSVSEPSSKASGEIKQPEVKKEKSFQERLEEGLKMREKYTSLIERLNLRELIGRDTTYLELQAKDLTDEDMPFIDYFLSTHEHKIYSLNLIGNQLTKIPFFSSLLNLQYLYLKENQITEIGDLSKMPKLKRLNLSVNRLTGKIDLSNLKLEILNIKRNKVLPVGDRKNIKDLYFDQPVEAKEEDPCVLFMKTSLKNVSTFFNEEKVKRLSNLEDNQKIQEAFKIMTQIIEKLE